MIAKLEKHLSIIFIILLLAILACYLLLPSLAQAFSWTIAVSGIVLMAIYFTRRNYISYRKGLVTRIALIRNIVFELIGIVITISVAIWLAGKVLARVLPVVYIYVLTVRPAWVPIAGMLAGLIVALCVGLGVGLVMRLIWGMLTGFVGKLFPPKSQAGKLN
jgi:hypothetical protein